MIAGTWLARGDEYRVMVISYEKQLVWQFAEEVRDFLGIEPGIEMEKERASSSDRIVVASRASLLLAPEVTFQQRERFIEYGIDDLGPLWKSRAESYLKMLHNRHAEPEQIRDQIAELKQRPEAHGDKWSRLHRFDPRLNWLLCFDEAHRHVRKLRSVGYLTEWFWTNPNTKQLGLTATPKRADGVSIGSEMFPAIAADYPLFHFSKPCAVKDGYAVPYVQRYISVEGVDFKNLKRVAGDFDDGDLERVLGEESTLAKLCQPLLDMVGDRRTLIFSPGVEMAGNVARFINARSEAVCSACQHVAWYPKLLIGDGATCQCGALIADEDVTKAGDQARSIHGGTRLDDRKDVYEGHQSGQFQFLSVCGLCREGYNDPDIGCVAIFRPVSKKASSLAEQMKGRGCRPEKALIRELCTIVSAEERRQLIADSEKPNCLIVDLVGVTGLDDCASTTLIYAEGTPDGVLERAQQIAEESDDDVDIEEAIEQAAREDAEEKERIKRERDEAERLAKEEFERRAKAEADVSYSVHDVGHSSSADPREATSAQYKFLESLGISIVDYALTKKQAGRLIDKLLSGEAAEDATYETGIDEEHWKPKGPSGKQVSFAAWKHIDISWCRSPSDATLAISARMNRGECRQKLIAMLQHANTHDALNSVGRKMVRCGMHHDETLIALGKRRRADVRAQEEVVIDDF
jgi:superfamily II DNA or RNA helicase